MLIEAKDTEYFYFLCSSSSLVRVTYRSANLPTPKVEVKRQRISIALLLLLSQLKLWFYQHRSGEYPQNINRVLLPEHNDQHH